jgi:hypothetical protein
VYGGAGYNVYTVAGAPPPAGWNYIGEDVSLSVDASAASGAQTSVITVALIPT